MLTQQQSDITTLATVARQHRGVNHPYLTALMSGDLPNPKQAILDFAVQYQGYTSWFPKYLNCVMSKLESQQHRSYFQENLDEESGHLDDATLADLSKLGIKSEWVQGIPHPILFRRFQLAVALDARTEPLARCAIKWRKKFLELLQNATAAEAIGAMGLGTESMVKHIYRPITEAIKTFTDISQRDYVFFELHSEVDDDHAELMMRVADDLANGDTHCFTEIERGMNSALDLRAQFWDQLYIRAKAQQ
jgi:pyrroloquinoline quinone (PQQ) biosynthesis protein C